MDKISVSEESMEYLLNFVDIVKDYIAKEGITLKEFAKRIHTAESAVEKWLDTTYFPTMKCVINVADLLDCSLDYVFGITSKYEFTRGRGNEKFFDRFELLCKEKHLTYYQIAKKCNFGQSMISKWKKGKYPKPESLIKVAKLFNCSLDYLVGRSDFI